jgi:hypothetical protein
MKGAMAVLIEFRSSRWGDITKEENIHNIDNPSYNTANQSLGNMVTVTDRLQVSTGRVLLHELFYLYAKMDVIQSLVGGSTPLYSLCTIWLT